MSKGQWHGTNIRGPMFFHYGTENASPDIHPVQFEAVSSRIMELANTLDGNGRAVLKLVFTRPDHINPVIAYQWTSEWADNKFDHELVKLGGSLGRGMWKCFGEDVYAQHIFDEFVR